MEDQSTSTPSVTPASPKACINCGNPQILHGYPNALCEECREKYIKYPIPVWVKIFGTTVLVLVVFALFSASKSFSLGIRYEKGIKAEEAKKYVTEQQIMQALVKENPDYLEAKAHLMIAAFYNGDIATATEMSQKMANQKFDDDELLAKANAVVHEAESEQPHDSLNKYMELMPDSTGGIPDSIYIRIIKADPDDLYTKVKYASILIDQNNYPLADSLLTSVLRIKPNFISALELKISITRANRNINDCLHYCHQLLDINSQSVYAISCIARSYLKTGEVEKGLQYAREAILIQPNDPYANATIVLAYHFNKMIKERDALILKINQGKDSLMKSYLTFPLDVINHKDSI